MRRFTQSLLALGCGFATLGLGAARARAAALPADKLPEPAIMGVAGPDTDYLRRLHSHVHKRWADNFLRLIGEKLEASNPLNVAERDAEVDVTIAADGQMPVVKVTRSSGLPGFDDTIIDVLRDSVPFPSPPVSVRSDDDKVHLRWVFARDQRRCSGVTAVRVNDPLEIAAPKLLRTGRSAEAIARVVTMRGMGMHAEPMLSVLATEWMKGAVHEAWTTARMARLMADRGDATAIAWLKEAVGRADVAAAAGEALAANKVPVCPLVKAKLEGASVSEQQTAATALATTGEAACAPGLIKLLENPKAKPEARIAAAVALGPIEDDGAKKSLAAAGKDEPNVAVRAAALLATVRPGAGRGKVLAMVRFIRDPSPDLRAASTAGVVRAGGDSNLADLYVLFKEEDKRPLLAALQELEHLKTEEAIKLVARLAKRPQPPVQKLAAEILVHLQARASYPALKGNLEGTGVDPELRALSLVAADDAVLIGLAEDPKQGIFVYRALLARGERDRAGDWLLAHAAAMPPPALAGAMTDWLATAPAGAATADARKSHR